MDNYNIKLDRPKLTSEEIVQRKDFDTLMNNHEIIKRPFRKSPWFFGVTGMATIGLLLGGVYTFTSSSHKPEEQALQIVKNDSPKLEAKLVSLEVMEPAPEKVLAMQSPHENKRELKKVKNEKKNNYDNTNTLIENTVKPMVEEPAVQKEKKPSEPLDKSANVRSGYLDNHPRINGKIGGKLKMSEVENNFNILTDSEIEVLSFELHVVTEFGAKVYQNNSNALTNEMKNAILKQGVNSEIYFENIQGDVGGGKKMRLSPLKYSLSK
ncbi:hypothetical protein DNU06_15110 [Putridiphycobacter roseus]|uniref:Uncharacterized protein n=1 Tax=Putridiphycobacter roseus TaxID=2219161 RepID=A0A2W1MX86_9FLAO|nr:hypothetical protein [Putridiphycobacter roseus]PZE15974.1 hypothetical protein DNU06_15110 [Putridiphycobacter roseus]